MAKAIQMAKETFSEFSDDKCPSMAAALAYYTVFSLPALLVLLVMVTGVIWGAEAVEGRIESEVARLIGPEGATAVHAMIRNASRPENSGWIPTLLGLATLAFGATGAFAQLQDALNQAWEVEPEDSGIKGFAVKRLLSFGLILGIAFLLLVSLALSAAITAVGERIGSMLPGEVSEPLLFGLDLGLSLCLITLLFAAIFKFLPDAEVVWGDVWVGAGMTALLFVLGKLAIGFYLGESDPGASYGAAGSIVLIMAWIYYASMILLLGAELTQVWSRHYGSRIVPEEGAVQVVQETRRVSREEAQREADRGA